jgi:presenilin-like A22 family membrane protease
LVLAGVFAAAVSFAATFSLNFLLILLICFSFYDIVGVFFIKAIPRVAKNAARIGIPLLLTVPKKMKDIFNVPTPDTTASLLGAGDLFIPLLFLMSVSVRVGWEIALVSFVGVVLGSLGNIALVRKIKTGIPAVPLLAIGLAVGYGVGLLIFG